MRVVVIASLMLVAGCSGEEAREPRLPRLTDAGGPKLLHPRLVPIVYADEVALVDRLTTYSQWIVASSWLTAVGAEYGITPGSAAAVVQLQDSSPPMIDDTQIVDALFQHLGDGTLPQPTPDTLYMFHYPLGTVVTNRGSRSCQDFGGYHYSARRSGIEVAYAVIADCFDLSLEEVISHELIEAATDPFPSNNPGIQLRDPVSPWLALGGEVADLCERGGDASGRIVEAGHTAQRSWSSEAATAEQDPCVPTPAGYGSEYVSVAADLKTVPRIRPGEQQTIDLTGWVSNSPSAFNWTLRAVPFGGSASFVTLKLGSSTLTNGESTTLNVAISPSAMVGSAARMAVFSYVGDTVQYLPLYAIVGDPCASFSDCATCASHTGCGFCESSGTCQARGESGSAEGCSGHFAVWSGSCPGFCASHSASCTDCASQYGCGWCASGGTPACMEASQAYSHPESGQCAYADWSFTPSYCPR